MIWELHHTDFEKFLAIFDQICERAKIEKSFPRDRSAARPREIRNSLARINTQMSAPLAYLRRRGFRGAAVLGDAQSILNMHGPVKGRAHIEKIQNKKKES